MVSATRGSGETGQDKQQIKFGHYIYMRNRRKRKIEERRRKDLHADRLNVVTFICFW
jgi:hypothetical protein